MATVTASVARQTLPAQLDRVEAGEEVEITRHGRVVAVLVSPEVLLARRAPAAWDQAERVGELLERARRAPLRPAALSVARAEELVAALDVQRSAK